MPVFSVVLSGLFLDLLLVLFLPYMATRYGDSPFASLDYQAFAGLSILTAMVFGTYCAVVAEERGRNLAWFFAGNLGAVVAPILGAMGWTTPNPDGGLATPTNALLFVVSTGILASGLMLVLAPRPAERGAPRPIGSFLAGLGRFWHAVGNIWFGIGLLIVLLGAMAFGIGWEDKYGTKSVHHVVWTSPWFGIIFLTFSASLIAATVRKFPWRLDQTGWILVHLALVVMIIGSFITYFGKREGTLTLAEGEHNDRYTVGTYTKLVIEEELPLVGAPEGSGAMRWAPVWEDVPRFDLDPSEREPKERFEVDLSPATMAGAGPHFTVVAEEYFGNAERSHYLADRGTEPRPGVRLEIVSPGGGTQSHNLIAMEGRANLDFGILKIGLRETPHPRFLSALRGGRDFEGHGHLLITRRSTGEELARVPVEPGKIPDSAAGAQSSLANLEVKVPLGDQEVLIKGLRYFDTIGIAAERGGAYDMAPGLPYLPAVLVRLASNEKTEVRVATGYDLQELGEGIEEGPFADLRIAFDYLPAYPVQQGELLLAVSEEGTLAFASSQSTGVQRGEVAEGEPLPLGLPVTVRPARIFRRAALIEEMKWLDYNKGGGEAVRIKIAEVPFADGSRDDWLLVNLPSSAVSAPFVITDDEGNNPRTFRVHWKRPEEPLGFRLALREFHRDFYPGSTAASSFESYLWLSEHKQYKQPVGIKIDMNHPLRLDGWRLFQSRFESRGSGPETTILQVNRDPGLLTTYIGCALLSLSLVIVFFQKPFMRAWAQWQRFRGVKGMSTFLASLGIVGLSLLSVVPGIAMIWVTPEGPLLGVGILLITGGLIADSLFKHLVLRQRFLRRLEAQAQSSSGSAA